MDGLHELEDAHGSVIVDERALPIITVEWVRTPSPELVDRYFDLHETIMTRLAAQGLQCVLVTLTAQANLPSALTRKQIAARNSTAHELAERTIIANAVVINNTAMRGVMTAISWLDPNLKVTYLESAQAAEVWARAELATLTGAASAATGS